LKESYKNTIMCGMRVKPILVTLFLAFYWAMKCGAQAVLTWNSFADPTAAGYNVSWGTNGGVYLTHQFYNNGITNAEIDGLVANQVYYFNIAAVTSNGTVIAPTPSNDVMFTYSLPETNSLDSGSGATNAGPPSPGGPGAPTTNSPTIANNTSGSTNTSSQTGSTNMTQSLFWGVPPFMTMFMSNGQPTLNIGGTVGATLMVESSPSIMSMDGWSEVTNVSVTNIAPVALASPPSQPEDALDLAFVPGLETVALAPTNLPGPVYYRVVMPYDYVILASMVLPTKGYTPRLILVNMPGIVSDDACYVGQSSSFIHFDRSTYALQLEESGSTVRQIATQLANSLNLNWTSASEFTYSNGLSQILATVVETEPPSNDPVAGKASRAPSNVIDF